MSSPSLDLEELLNRRVFEGTPEPALTQLLRSLPLSEPPARAADLGAGPASTAVLAAAFEGDIVAVNKDGDQLQAVREAFPRAILLRQPLETSAPFSVQLALMMDVLMHVAQDHREEVLLTAAANWVAPGGFLVVAQHDHRGVMGQLALMMGAKPPALATIVDSDKFVVGQVSCQFPANLEWLTMTAHRIVDAYFSPGTSGYDAAKRQARKAAREYMACLNDFDRGRATELYSVAILRC